MTSRRAPLATATVEACRNHQATLGTTALCRKPRACSSAVLQGDQLHEIDEEHEADPDHGRQHVQQAHQEGEHLQRVGRDQADDEQGQMAVRVATTRRAPGSERWLPHAVIATTFVVVLPAVLVSVLVRWGASR